MKTLLFKLFFVVAAITCTLPGIEARAQTESVAWNQWRGPQRDGVATNLSLPDKLDGSTLKRLWRVEMGPSYSGPVIDDKNVYVTESRDDKSEVVRAFDRETGEQVWESSWQGAMKVPFFAAANGSWVRSTPVLDENRLYVGGMVDHLVCLDTKDGKIIWQINFPRDKGTPKPDFGFASSPLIWNDALYVQAGAAFHKINKLTGEIIWKSLDDGGGMNGSAFASPMVATLHGVPQLIVQTRSTLCGVDPNDGRVLWSREIPNFRGMNILTPLIVENSIFTSSYQNKAWRLDINKQGENWSVTQAWEVPRAAYMSSPVYFEGHIYLHLGNQRFICIDFKSGEIKWTSEPFGKYSSLLLSGNRIVALDQRGEILMIEATPDKFNLLSQFSVSDQETWAHLAAGNEEFYVRELKAMSVWRIDAR